MDKEKLALVTGGEGKEGRSNHHKLDIHKVRLGQVEEREIKEGWRGKNEENDGEINEGEEKREV